MSKQGEIQAKSHQIIEENLRIDDGKAWFTLEGLDELFTYLHSQKVRLEVDKELPEKEWERWGLLHNTDIKAKMGFFESLIEEKIAN